MKKNLLPISFSLILLIGDQITKYLFYGSFISTFSGHYKQLFFLIVILIVIFRLFKSLSYSTFERWALWVLIGGFISNNINNTNLYTFSRFPLLPQFNIADITVAISTLIVLLSILLKDRSFQ